MKHFRDARVFKVRTVGAARLRRWLWLCVVPMWNCRPADDWSGTSL